MAPGPKRGTAKTATHKKKLSQAGKKAWETRRKKYGPGGGTATPTIDKALKNPGGFDVTALTPTQVRRLTENIWFDAASWAKELFGIELWSKQKEVCQAIRLKKRVCIRSGNGVGKSQVAAVIAVLFMIAHCPSTVVLTSSTWRGIEQILFPYVKELYRKSKMPLGVEPLSTKWELSDRWLMVGVSASEPENFAGYHNNAVLVIVDEASALEPKIMEAIEGLCVGDDDRILMIGNPLRPGGPFYDAFRTQDWHNIHISTLESPNVITGKTIIPGLATREWVESRGRAWGERSPAYEARVLGEFPSEGEDTLIALSSVEAMCERPMPENGLDHTSAILGVDVARYGSDYTVFVIRDDHAIHHLEKKQGFSTAETAQRAAYLAREFRVTQVRVDDIGVGGGVVDTLVTTGTPGVIPVNNSSLPEDQIQFANTRSESYSRMADALKGEEGLAAPIEYKDELYQLASIKKKYNNKGQLVIEPKEKIRERIGRSPDVPDALALTYASSIDGVLWPSEYFSYPGFHYDGLFPESPVRVAGLKVPHPKPGYVAISLLVADESRICYVEGHIGQWGLEGGIKRCLELMRMSDITHLGVDNETWERVFQADLARIARSMNFNPIVYPLDNRGLNSITRVKRLEPYLVNHQFRFRGDHLGTQALIDQTRKFPTSRYTEGPESLEFALRVAVDMSGVRDDGLGSRLHV